MSVTMTVMVEVVRRVMVTIKDGVVQIVTVMMIVDMYVFQVQNLHRLAVICLVGPLYLGAPSQTNHCFPLH